MTPDGSPADGRVHYQYVQHIEVDTLAGDDQVGFLLNSNNTITTVKVDGGTHDGSTQIRDGFKIIGSDMDDTIRVGDFASGDRFRVQLIETLQLFGMGGNDTLTNDTSVDSLIDGGTGDDALTGGYGNNVIFGGAGKDALLGRCGAGRTDYFFPDHEYLERDTYGYPQPYFLAGETVEETGSGIANVVAWGDSVTTDGSGQLIVKGGTLSVLDWLKARFPEFNATNINLLFDEAFTLPCTDNFQCGVQPAPTLTMGPSITSVVVAEAGVPKNYVNEAGENLVMTWAAASTYGIASQTVKVDGSLLGATINGPYSSLYYSCQIGSWGAGTYNYTITSIDTKGVSSSVSGSFTLVDPLPPSISSIVVVEADGPRNGSLASDETLVITWAATSSRGVVSQSMTVDGITLAPINGPYGGLYYSCRIGNWAAGDHTYVIRATDSIGSSSGRTGTFTVVAGAAQAPRSTAWWSPRTARETAPSRRTRVWSSPGRRRAPTASLRRR